MPKQDDFALVFARLKAILEPYEKKCEVLQDIDTHYYLNTRHLMKNKQPLFFGGVRSGKAYVSFHLMPVYACPELAKGISPALKRHMQGKSCFNFKAFEAGLFRELSRLTKAGFARFSDEKFLNTLRQAQERRPAKKDA